MFIPVKPIRVACNHRPGPRDPLTWLITLLFPGYPPPLAAVPTPPGQGTPPRDNHPSSLGSHPPLAGVHTSP